MDDEDLYATLGVDPSADAESVRRAYRKLAVRWHPDKNPGDSATAEVMFKKVAAAYEVLSDERKRAAYDGERAEQRAGTDPRGSARARGARAPGRGASRFGAEFGFGGGFTPHHDPFEVFREAFGGRDPFADDPFFAAARSRFGVAPNAPSLFRDADPLASAALGAGFGVPFFDAFDAFGTRAPRRLLRSRASRSESRRSEACVKEAHTAAFAATTPAAAEWPDPPRARRW